MNYHFIMARSLQQRCDVVPCCVTCCWVLLYVPATCQCISGMDLLRQVHMLPHWERSSRPNFLSRTLTVYWHQAKLPQLWPYNARCLAGEPLEYPFLNRWYDLTQKKINGESGNRSQVCCSCGRHFTTGPTRPSCCDRVAMIWTEARVRTASTSAVGRPSPTRRVPTWRIGERPPDMRVSCDTSRACPDE